jgi:hypothetical protein
MQKVVFKATIKGLDLVQKTGPIRVPTSFRIRIYDDGEAVITTRGKLADTVWKREFFSSKHSEDYLPEAIMARLSDLAGQGRAPKVVRKVSTRSTAPNKSRGTRS